MQQRELQFLKDIYDHYLKTGDRVCGISFNNSEPLDKKNTLDILKYLEECAFIRFEGQAIGFCQFRITAEGIKFAENGFKEPDPVPVVQGDHNILISGANNTVSGNYNQISVDIQQADLPTEYKELIEAFLYEMKNSHLTPEKKSNKIKTFLADISSGTISGVAANALTALLSGLLAQVLH